MCGKYFSWRFVIFIFTFFVSFSYYGKTIISFFTYCLAHSKRRDVFLLILTGYLLLLQLEYCTLLLGREQSTTSIWFSSSHVFCQHVIISHIMGEWAVNVETCAGGCAVKMTGSLVRVTSYIVYRGSDSAIDQDNIWSVMFHEWLPTVWSQARV